VAAEDREDQHAGPRAFWSGTITFGLVSVPVDLYPAVRSNRVPLRMLGPEGQPLQRRYFCSADGRPLAYDDLVRGYEWDDGSYTVVTDEELDALEPRKSRDIDLRRFVKREEIPPELLERPYVLAPSGDSTKAYHLLAQTMEQSGRAGIATFVMRGKEYLAAIFAEGGLLRAHTMRFVDELRTPDDIGLPAVRKVAASERKAAEAALARLEKDDIDPRTLHDDYADALHELAERKRAEGTDVIEVEEAPAEDEEEAADVIDIMSVLKERMGAARGPARAPAREKSERPRTAREPSEPARAASPRSSVATRGDGPAPERRGPKRDALEHMSKKELYAQAQELELPNRSQMSKEQLVEAIRRAS
jgi:DNA end-binding protein Ku